MAQKKVKHLPYKNTVTLTGYLGEIESFTSKAGKTYYRSELRCWQAGIDEYMYVPLICFIDGIDYYFSEGDEVEITGRLRIYNRKASVTVFSLKDRDGMVYEQTKESKTEDSNSSDDLDEHPF